MGTRRLWTMENLVPDHKLKQHLQIIFGRTKALKEVIDRAIECDDELRRKKCMRVPETTKEVSSALEEMDKEETGSLDQLDPPRNLCITRRPGTKK